MSLQTILNAQAISTLPKIKNLINNVSKQDTFITNQMVCKTLQEMCNSCIAIDDMSKDQLNKFQDELIEIFKHKNWI